MGEAEPVMIVANSTLAATISELPPAPAGVEGWPWQADTETPFDHSDLFDLPKISVITPSYNQARYIEETIRSVLLQGYPNLEYIIIDGGSSDQTTEIIKKYEPWLTYWVSEPDRGQSDAINKGFSKSTGRILNWLNSDDFLEKNALGRVATAFGAADEHVGAVVGIGCWINEFGEIFQH